ncbi:MAG: hypothetical protein LUF25_01830 [Phascolarctobacterium sp.]|nr:hypothetical protein [Phascolarctobacterium sp.]
MDSSRLTNRGKRRLGRQFAAKNTESLVRVCAFQASEFDESRNNEFTNYARNQTSHIIGGADPAMIWEETWRNFNDMFNDLPEEERKIRLFRAADYIVETSMSDMLRRDDYKFALTVMAQWGQYMTPEKRSQLNAPASRDAHYIQRQARIESITGKNLTEDQKREVLLSNNGYRLQEVPITYKSGVTGEGLTEKASRGMAAMASLFKDHYLDFTVTSTKNDFAGHAQGSSHYTGYAIDFVSDAFENMTPEEQDAFVAKMERACPGIIVLNEYRNPSAQSTAGHIHANLSKCESIPTLHQAGRETDGGADTGSPEVGRFSEMEVDAMIDESNQKEARDKARLLSEEKRQLEDFHFNYLYPLHRDNRFDATAAECEAVRCTAGNNRLEARMMSLVSSFSSGIDAAAGSGAAGMFTDKPAFLKIKRMIDEGRYDPEDINRAINEKINDLSQIDIAYLMDHYVRRDPRIKEVDKYIDAYIDNKFHDRLDRIEIKYQCNQIFRNELGHDRSRTLAVAWIDKLDRAELNRGRVANAELGTLKAKYPLHVSPVIDRIRMTNPSLTPADVRDALAPFDLNNKYHREALRMSSGDISHESMNRLIVEECLRDGVNVAENQIKVIPPSPQKGESWWNRAAS